MIELEPVGFVSRISPDEDERERSLVAKIVLEEDLEPGLKGIEAWSHIYVIFWMGGEADAERRELCQRDDSVGVFAARSPIHPNPLGLTLVELIKREGNVLWVKGLDAFDGTPVLDIKPYPDWEKGRSIVVTDYRIPDWLAEILERHQSGLS